MIVFLHLLVNFFRPGSEQSICCHLFRGVHSTRLVVLLPFLAAPLYNLNKTKQLRLTKSTVRIGQPFLYHSCGKTKNGTPIMNSKSAAWIQPPGGCGLIGWSRAYQKVRPDLCRRGPIAPSQKGPTKKQGPPLLVAVAYTPRALQIFCPGGQVYHTST